MAALVLVFSPGVPTVQSAPNTTINPLSGATTAFFLGDSLTVGADAFGSLRSKLLRLDHWQSVTLDARVGRTLKQGVPLLKERLRRFPATPVVFIALGTNDLLSIDVTKPALRTFPQKIIDQVMSTVGARPVIWTNVTYGAIHPDWIRRAKRFNQALVTATSRYPNLRIIDWASAISPSTNWYQYDGIHVSPTGYRFRATHLVTSIDRLWPTLTTTTSTSTTSTVATSTTGP